MRCPGLFVTVETPTMILGGGGGATRQVVDAHSTLYRLRVLQFKVRDAIVGVADIIVVTGYAPQHNVLEPFVGDDLPFSREARASLIQQ